MSTGSTSFCSLYFSRIKRNAGGTLPHPGMSSFWRLANQPSTLDFMYDKFSSSPLWRESDHVGFKQRKIALLWESYKYSSFRGQVLLFALFSIWRWKVYTWQPTLRSRSFKGTCRTPTSPLCAQHHTSTESGLFHLGLYKLISLDIKTFQPSDSVASQSVISTCDPRFSSNLTYLL